MKANWTLPEIEASIKGDELSIAGIKSLIEYLEKEIEATHKKIASLNSQMSGYVENHTDKQEKRYRLLAGIEEVKREVWECP